MNAPIIEVSYDEVSIENFIVLRPPRISAKQWMEFWEAAQRIEFSEEENLIREIDSLREEVKDLQDENSALIDRLQEVEQNGC